MCLWILSRDTYRTMINPKILLSCLRWYLTLEMVDSYGESWLRPMQVWRTTVQIDSNSAIKGIQSRYLWLWCDKIRIWVFWIFRSTRPKLMCYHIFKRWKCQSSTGNHKKCKTWRNSKFQSFGKLDGYERGYYSFLNWTILIVFSRDHIFKSVHAMKSAKKIYSSMLSTMSARMSRRKILWNRLPHLIARVLAKFGAKIMKYFPFKIFRSLPHQNRCW